MSQRKPLWQWSASEIAKATKAGEVSVAEVVAAMIDRMGEANPDLNAVVENLAEEARQENAA